VRGFTIATAAGSLLLAMQGPLAAQECALMPADRQAEILTAAQLGPADLRALESDLETIRSAADILTNYGQTAACGAVAEAVAAIVANPTIIQERTRAAFLVAEPLGGARALAATDLLDQELIALNGREVGRVEDLWLDPDESANLVLVSLRGALGIGAAHIAVPYEFIRFGTGDRVYLGLSTEQLEAAPRLEDRGLLLNEAWRADNARFYTPILASLVP
jgi:hypothetical protein